MDGDFTADERSRQFEGLALFMHGKMATEHTIGCAYHLIRGSKKHAIIHGLSASYSFFALIEHWTFYRNDESR